MEYKLKTAEFDELVEIMRSYEGFNEEMYSDSQKRLADLKESGRGGLLIKNARVSFNIHPSKKTIDWISIVGITEHSGSINGNAVWRGVAEKIAKKHGVAFDEITRHYPNGPDCRDHYTTCTSGHMIFKDQDLKQELEKVVSAEKELYGKIEQEIQRILG